MKTGLINIVAIIVGLVIGSIVNMSIVNISGTIIPPPSGVNVTTMEGLQESMHLFEPKHFLFPFLAHAIGTLVGAFMTASIAKTKKLHLAFTIGILFLFGGIMMVFMVPSPIWFSIADLGLAYLPMAYFAYKLSTFLFKKKEELT